MRRVKCKELSSLSEIQYCRSERLMAVFDRVASKSTRRIAETNRPPQKAAATTERPPRGDRFVRRSLKEGETQEDGASRRPYGFDAEQKRRGSIRKKNARDVNGRPGRFVGGHK